MGQDDAKVSIRCDQCGDAAGDRGVAKSWPTEAAAVEAVTSGGWYVRGDGRVWCQSCEPVLACETDEGHDFTPWHPDAIRGDVEYRECTRCPLQESHPSWQGLSPAQADGLGCVVCGADYLRVSTPHVPVGRSGTGSQVFACVGRCAAGIAGAANSPEVDR